jgi:hypothetical protein
MIDYERWLGKWKRETPHVRQWYWQFCSYDKRIDELVKRSPFPIIGVKHTEFDYNSQIFLEEPCLQWCFRNLESDDYAEVFVIEQGTNDVHRPVRATESANAVMRVRAIMFKDEETAAWFKLSFADKVCDAYAWANLGKSYQEIINDVMAL